LNSWLGWKPEAEETRNQTRVEAASLPTIGWKAEARADKRERELRQNINQTEKKAVETFWTHEWKSPTEEQ
jgi:hypothetical protein